jgi:hypothetical protein
MNQAVRGKEAVFALVERGGRVRSHHVPQVNAKTLRPILQAHVDGATLVATPRPRRFGPAILAAAVALGRPQAPELT